jgi:hypothetical protein
MNLAALLTFARKGPVGSVAIKIANVLGTQAGS